MNARLKSLEEEIEKLKKCQVNFGGIPDNGQTPEFPVFLTRVDYLNGKDHCEKSLVSSVYEFEVYKLVTAFSISSIPIGLMLNYTLGT